MTELVDVPAVALTVLLVGYWLYDHVQTEPTEVEKAHEAYRSGEISQDELERRVELALDPEAERIREAVEPINGVGPATSASIAEEYRSLEEIRRSSAGDLEEIHGVGPSTSRAIKERL